MKKQIPVYDICNLQQANSGMHDFIAERFGAYLKRHSQNLHLAHRHSFYHLVLFTKGTGTHNIDFNQFTVKPNQIYFMVPGQVHSWNFTSEPDGYIINFSETLFRSFLLNPNYLDRFAFFNGISEDCVCTLPTAEMHKVVSFFEEILLQVTSGRRDLDMIRLLLLQVFITTEQASNFATRKFVPEQKQILLRNFRRLIDQYYRTARLPKEYADLLYVTPGHLNALCQDLLDKTAGELIRDRILLEAKRLLTNAEMSITEIAYDLNFKDNSYFTRFFKKYEGVTPEEFRKQLAQPAIQQ
ncbi:AraC family transcriptional regulator [Foetidibacter luteolus]|uniref:AraC family transcriptional regulator n=1 Tax=Foetidibacter luteolus TaxID=2608880 RepID=UPI00129B19FB|nr:helix-turn-helix domain-containing protein [Foetidibacter luteolus]